MIRKIGIPKYNMITIHHQIKIGDREDTNEEEGAGTERGAHTHAHTHKSDKIKEEYIGHSTYQHHQGKRPN